MAYAGVIAKVRKVRPLIMKNGEEASSVNLATVFGYQIVLGKDIKEDTLGIYFPPEGQLSREMCMANKLYRKHPDTGEPMGGYFGPNGRIRVQKFLNQESWGYWTTLDSLRLPCVSEDIFSKLSEGDEITHMPAYDGEPYEQLICRKYYSPKATAAMQRAQSANSKNKKKRRFEVDSFQKHYDTGKLRIKGRNIPVGSVLYLTEKCHGCVSEDTIIETLEHGPMNIKDIVGGKLNLHIKALDIPSGEVVYSRIGDWYLLEDDGEWYEVELEDGTILKITGNNPVWMPEIKAYRLTEELEVGDCLLVD
jgi:intein/homing endonuclease